MISSIFCPFGWYRTYLNVAVAGTIVRGTIAASSVAIASNGLEADCLVPHLALAHGSG